MNCQKGVTQIKKHASELGTKDKIYRGLFKADVRSPLKHFQIAFTSTKVTSICIARLRERLERAQIWFTQCYLQIAPYMYLPLPVSIPQAAPPCIYA